MIGSLLPAILFFAVAITMIVAAILAHRGQAFWGTWMMLVGSIGATLGAIGTAISFYYLVAAVGALGTTTSSTTTGDSMAFYGIISGIASLVSIGSLLIFLVGLMGLASRYGAVIRRVSELEAITASLMSKQDQG